MNKRDMVYNSFNGLCAYTGKPLGGDWQIDHIIPVCHPVWYQPYETRKSWLGISYNKNDAENLLPACRMVNHYKRSLDLEEFRKYMLNFHVRLSKLPKKTMIKKTQKRKEYMHKVGRYG
jgi:5-methylcytosine-specific restriction endonuclease McrA